MLVINNDDVKRLLNVPACLKALEAGYEDLAKGEAGYRPRIDVFVPSARPDGYFRWGSVEGASRSLETFAIRVKSDIVYWPDGKSEEKYCIQPGTYCGLILVMSTRNAEPLALMNDGYLQQMRTGGCAGLGVKYLARPDARTVGILGSGGMARAYLRAFCAVRPIEKVKVYGPERDQVEAYAREMTEALTIPVQPADSPEDVASDVDILASATSSILPTLKPEWVRPGMHFTNLNPYEVPGEILDRCDVVIKLGADSPNPQSLGPQFQYRGEFASLILGTPEERKIIPMPRTPRFEARSYPHLVDLLAGEAGGRTDPGQTTFFVNMGTQGLQFAALAGMVVQLAQQEGVGRQLPIEWFTQDIRD